MCWISTLKGERYLCLFKRKVQAKVSLVWEAVDSDGKDSLHPAVSAKIVWETEPAELERPAKKQGLSTSPSGPSRGHSVAHLPWSWGYWVIIFYTAHLFDNRLHLLHLLKDSQFIVCLLINHDSWTVCKYASNWREKVREAGLVWVCLRWGTPAQSHRNGPSLVVVSPLPLWNPYATTLFKTEHRSLFSNILPPQKKN